MNTHGIEDKKLKKKYGNRMVYKYGCEPGEYKVFIYRITQTNKTGEVRDLSIEEIIERTKDWPYKLVPILKELYIYDGRKEELLRTCEELSQGPSALDKEHIREGVVLRVDTEERTRFLKYKSWLFCDLEGIAKNTNDYVDLEEIS
jgi:hypothetical protein